VIVIGGGIVGSEATLLLAQQGKKVTITTRQSDIANGLTTEMRRAFFKMIGELSVEKYTGVRLEEVKDDGVVVGTFLSLRNVIKGDTVVIARSFEPNLTFWEELSHIPELEVYAIGDCVEPRTAYDAIHEGFHTALALI
jgi:pyruvate/2-oxoglutarate dehydrogenase complex dihydrolipoamide dehydrogenase (E3) component